MKLQKKMNGTRHISFQKNSGKEKTQDDRKIREKGTNRVKRKKGRDRKRGSTGRVLFPR